MHFNLQNSKSSALFNITAGGFQFGANSQALIERSAKLKRLLPDLSSTGGVLVLDLDGAIFFHILRFLQHGVFPRLNLREDPQKLDLVACQILEHQAKILELGALREGALKVVASFAVYSDEQNGKLRELQMDVYTKNAP